jgi:hypothetical protein
MQVRIYHKDKLYQFVDSQAQKEVTETIMDTKDKTNDSFRHLRLANSSSIFLTFSKYFRIIIEVRKE